MTTTIQDLYTQVVSTLPPNEQLQLATLILNGIVQQNAEVNSEVMDDSDNWTDQDQQDLAAFSLHYAATTLLEEEETAE